MLCPLPRSQHLHHSIHRGLLRRNRSSARAGGVQRLLQSGQHYQSNWMSPHRQPAAPKTASTNQPVSLHDGSFRYDTARVSLTPSQRRSTYGGCVGVAISADGAPRHPDESESLRPVPQPANSSLRRSAHATASASAAQRDNVDCPPPTGQPTRAECKASRRYIRGWPDRHETQPRQLPHWAADRQHLPRKDHIGLVGQVMQNIDDGLWLRNRASRSN